MPLLMFRLPIIAGSSLTESGLVESAVLVGTAGLLSFLAGVLWAVSFGFCAGGAEVDVWPKLATDPASSDEASSRAVTRREKLFILKTSRLSKELDGKEFWGKSFQESIEGNISNR